METMKKILSRIGQFLLSFIRILKRAICCRRRKDDNLLPTTVKQVHYVVSQKQTSDVYEVQSNWEAWPETDNSNANSQDKSSMQTFHLEENTDFFKDMVPQIRKPKKIYIRQNEEEGETFVSNRLAMDPKAILSGPDLGVIDDNPSNWEDIENSTEVWDPNQLIRETKKAERKKRLAEHQRRKQERESRRAYKQDSSSNIPILNASDSKDKAKAS